MTESYGQESPSPMQIRKENKGIQMKTRDVTLHLGSPITSRNFTNVNATPQNKKIVYHQSKDNSPERAAAVPQE